MKDCAVAGMSAAKMRNDNLAGIGGTIGPASYHGAGRGKLEPTMQNESGILAWALSVTLALPAFAADTSQWTNVQSLERGTRIGIVQSDQKRVEGRFESASESGITLQADQSVTVTKEGIIRVYRRSGLSRTKRTLIGTAIGVAAGAIVAGAIGSQSNDEGFFGGDFGGIGGAASVAGGGGIGAAIGALSGGGYKTIYQRTVR